MKFILDKDKLEVQDEDEINSGSIQYYEVPVEKDSSWDNLTIEAVIAPKEGGAIIFDEAVSIAVVDGKIYIDRELSGSYAIGFKGYTIENEVKTYQISTNLRGIYFDIGAGQIIPTNNIPKPTEWEIYIAQMEAIANRAGQSADDAEESAQTATEQAEIATEQAENAETSANTSTEQAGIATEKAETATTKAEEASQSASNAKTSEDNAKESENNASSSANSASESATSAENSANSASESASSASNSAGTASRKASEAESSASSANESATNAENSKKTAQELVAGFNSTVETATTNFNNNSTQKTNEFNQNASDKTTAFNNNATEKTGDYNSNATSKTTAFNENAQAKTDEFNQQAESYNLRITDLEEETESLRHDLNKATLDTTATPSDNITLNNTIQAQLKKFVLYGKTEQFSTTGKNLIPLNKYDSSLIRQSFFKLNLPVNTYTISYNLDSFVMGTNSSMSFYLLLSPDNGPAQQILLESITSNTTTGNKTITFTTTDEITINASISSSIRISETAQNNGGVVKASNIMISVNGGDYEPYTRSEYQVQIQTIHKR